MISLRNGFLFIHIPKTAGNSIQGILKDYADEKVVCTAPHHDGVERFEIRADDSTITKHSTLLEYQHQFGAEVISKLFTFTCIRNPWDRMISFYFSPHRGPVSWNRRAFIDLVETVKPITNFISLNEDNMSNRNSFDNINYYIRYENLEQDFEQVCNLISIPFFQLPRRNNSDRQNFLNYYDKELIEIVAKRFQKEIRFFNYKFF